VIVTPKNDYVVPLTAVMITVDSGTNLQTKFPILIREMPF